MSAYDTYKSAVLGNPLDPAKRPSRVGTVKAIAELQDQIEGAQAGAIVKSTLSALQSVAVAPYAGIMAWVMTGADAGIYENTGTANAPAWTRRGDIPQFIVTAINVGAGTANAIQVTTDRPFPVQDGRAMLVVPVLAANTVSPPTLSLNGGVALPIVSNNGVNVVAGGLTVGSYVAGFVAGGKFRLLSDQATQAIANAAAASAAEAAGYASLIKNNWVVAGPFVGTGADADFPLPIDPGSAVNMFVVAGGVAQLITQGSYSLVYSGSNPFIRINIPVGVPFEVRIGNKIDVNTPADGSVSFAKIQNLTALRLLGRKTGAGITQEITAAELRDLFLPAGAVVDSVNVQSGAVFSITTTIPMDDTIPQNTEGTECLTATITPKSTTNKLRIRISGFTSNSAAPATTVWAIFNGGANAIAAGGVTVPTSDYVEHFTGTIDYTPGSTSLQTISLRVGKSGGTGTVIVSGQPAGRRFGGVGVLTMTIEEIKA